MTPADLEWRRALDAKDEARDALVTRIGDAKPVDRYDRTIAELRELKRETDRAKVVREVAREIFVTHVTNPTPERLTDETAAAWALRSAETFVKAAEAHGKKEEPAHAHERNVGGLSGAVTSGSAQARVLRQEVEPPGGYHVLYKRNGDTFRRDADGTTWRQVDGPQPADEPREEPATRTAARVLDLLRGITRPNTNNTWQTTSPASDGVMGFRSPRGLGIVCDRAEAISLMQWLGHQFAFRLSELATGKAEV